MRKLLPLLTALLLVWTAFAGIPAARGESVADGVSVADEEAVTAVALPAPPDFPRSGGPLFDGPFLRAGEAPRAGETFYRGRNLAVEIASFREYGSDIYLADVYVRSLDSLCRSYGGGRWGRGSCSVAEHARRSGAVLALTGDSGNSVRNGLMIGNGVVWKNTRHPDKDVGVLFRTGELAAYTQKEARAEGVASRTEEIWQTFAFGPMLMRGGVPAAEEDIVSNVKRANPRTVFGCIAPGHYALMVCDGRGTDSLLAPGETNRGLLLSEAAAVMARAGCTQAVNLDGGRSAAMVFLGRVLNNPPGGGRPLNDAVVLLDRDPLGALERAEDFLVEE